MTSFIQISAEDYLNQPEAKALLAAANANLKGKGKKPTSNGPGAAVHPVQLGEPISSFHIAELNHLGQKLGKVPEYDLEGDGQQGWGGKLVFGDQTITKDGIRWQTKKAAKAGLAELGLEAMKGMIGVPNIPKTGDWVRLLHEFYSQSSSSDAAGPVYMEYSIGLCFACTCTIPARPEPFGTKSAAFATKKAARGSAAMEAMKFLMEQGLADSEGQNVRIAEKNKAKLGAILNEPSCAQKVNDLSALLGLQPPQYRIVPNPHAPAGNILSGAAYFEDNPLLSGPVGTVRNVFGKKKAKEECAREVCGILMQLATEKGIFK
ncbi:hypothetical protein MMC31_007197 [Peltigera leucophlebia]|nr:hypothetical protein [Peltigera leucophlebia]